MQLFNTLTRLHHFTTLQWDFPLVALAQARLSWAPESIIDMLLNPSIKNNYTSAGYNLAPCGGICAYFPGNGGLLLAVAAVAGGFDVAGGSTVKPIGFPASWRAAVEGFDIAYP